MSAHRGVASVGCGLIGQKRAKALAGARLVACADVVRDRAHALAKGEAFATDEWREAIRRDDVEIVVVAVTNNLLAEITIGALEAGKHVLVETPAARSVAEIDRVIEAQKKSGALVRVGFNHRYHPALILAKELRDSGALGEMMFVRGR